MSRVLSVLRHSILGQVIVFENTEPPGVPARKCILLQTLTRSTKTGWYDFFPLSAED